MIFKSKSPAASAGEIAEHHALQYLQARQLKLVEKNYRCGLGEIDLIMEHGEALVFVEVRFRKNRAFGSAAETVTPAKQTKVRAAARHYLMSKGIGESRPMRFDIVAIDGAPNRGEDTTQWLQNAF